MADSIVNNKDLSLEDKYRCIISHMRKQIDNFEESDRKLAYWYFTDEKDLEETRRKRYNAITVLIQVGFDLLDLKEKLDKSKFPNELPFIKKN